MVAPMPIMLKRMKPVASINCSACPGVARKVDACGSSTCLMVAGISVSLPLSSNRTENAPPANKMIKTKIKRLNRPTVYLPFIAATWEAISDINEALTQFYDAPIGPAAYDEAKAPVQVAIAKAQNELSRRRSSIKRGLKDEGELLLLQHSGELILAYQHQIEPGQTVLVSQYEADNPLLEIVLDPSKSALENAQSYFRRYQKAKRARADGPKRLIELSTEGAFLEQLAVDLMLAENWPEIDEVKAALLSAGYLRIPKQQQLQKTKSGPRRFVCSGYIIWIGRNTRQNATILNRLSQANDLWFHVRGGSGAHAIIRDDGQNIPETLIQKVASMAAFYSSLRKEASVAVAVTERRHVRPIKGAKPGLVRYAQERTLWVSPQDESILEE